MKLFVSYSSKNHASVKKLAERLERLGDHEVWYDADLYIGDDWWDTILYRIGWCDALIFILTPESLASSYCMDEVAEAMRKEKLILPLQFDASAMLPSHMSHLQYTNFTADYEANLNRFREELATHEQEKNNQVFRSVLWGFFAILILMVGCLIFSVLVISTLQPIQ